MLLVMTMNVGYFFAVLTGILVGELIFGRFINAGHVRKAVGATIDNQNQ